MLIFAKISLSDSNYCDLFKLVKLELGGVDTKMYGWTLTRDKINSFNFPQYQLTKSKSQQFYLNGRMHFSFSEEDIK